jgi:Zn-dependent peptidase ImmA (M78 family)/DNA-binding XRE family transcriptional regulator
MKHARALVEPDILQWARESAGLAVDDAAKALQTKPENVVAWEDGDSHPSMPQLRRMAAAYKRLLSDFYLPKPPESTPLPHDFRRLPGEVAKVYSKELRYELRAAMERRRLALDLMEEVDSEAVRLSLRIDRRLGADEAARKIRDLLRVTFAEQNKWRESRTHYNAWRARLEAAGVLVFQVASVPKDQMLGFSLAARPLPVIAINRKLKPNGRTFTMLHEFVHVLLGENSLCDLDEEALRPPEEQAIEVYCNAVAACVLMPKEEFLAHNVVATRKARSEDWADSDIDTLGRSFGASEEAVLRRLLTFSMTTEAFYRKKRALIQARNQRMEETREDVEFKRNMPQEVVSNLGKPFTQIVLDTYAYDRLSLSDVSRYLGLRAGQVAKVREMVGG